MDVWGEMFSKVEGGVTDQSGPGADLGQIFFSLVSSVFPGLALLAVACLGWCCCCSGAKEITRFSERFENRGFACAGRASWSLCSC
jgi:hypothetical protein